MHDLVRFTNDLITNFPWLCALFAFGLGAIVGSYLNVCILRMPMEKSIFWPGSRCGTCLSGVRWYDNIPLISYWRLGGKCRTCGTPYSSRYFWIELLTACCFAGLFYLEVVVNVRNIGGLWLQRSLDNTAWRVQGWQFLMVWLCHATFVSLLIVATFTDIDHWEIPLGITIPGTLLGLVAGALFPWPWPMNTEGIGQLFPGWERMRFGGLDLMAEMTPPIPVGLQRWPFFLPTPDWAPAGSWQLGFATALAGALVGTLGMRLIRLIFSWGLKKEAMGLGDADLMMMIGAFLGWQALVLVLGFGVLLGLVYAVVLVVRAKGNELPFGPFLAGGALLALLDSWGYILTQGLFFDLQWVLLIGGFAAVLGLCLTLSIRMIRLIWEAA